MNIDVHLDKHVYRYMYITKTCKLIPTLFPFPDDGERVDFSTIYQAVKTVDGQPIQNSMPEVVSIEEVQDNVSS